MTSPRILLLPGFQNSGVGHWQTLWETQFGDLRVEQHDWMQPLRGDWITRLEDVVQQQPGPVLLAAHSLGCHLVAAWAAVSGSTAKVQGALLVAPPDVTQPNFPPQLHRWVVPVLNALPFPATLVASTDDPYCSFEAAEKLAGHWGTTVNNIGARGHINANSGLGDWPQGRALLLNQK
ncbi:RBBP9/YdeN family alpha/beta hydrolase [Rhodoferax sp.]|uniref:RBBP9/YdeN family alpha/beta hydrolase n=1 Tax=Rhodoferax sp. TaxID=50421 RepID=UPI00374DBADC